MSSARYSVKASRCRRGRTTDRLHSSCAACAPGNTPFEPPAALKRPNKLNCKRPAKTRRGGYVESPPATPSDAWLRATLAKQWAEVFDHATRPYQFALQARAGTDALSAHVRVALARRPDAVLDKARVASRAIPSPPRCTRSANTKRCVARLPACTRRTPSWPFWTISTSIPFQPAHGKP